MKIKLHWGTVLLAYLHRQEQGEAWVCDCLACQAVREALERGKSNGNLRVTLTTEMHCGI